MLQREHIDKSEKGGCTIGKTIGKDQWSREKFLFLSYKGPIDIKRKESYTTLQKMPNFFYLA